MSYIINPYRFVVAGDGWDYESDFTADNWTDQDSANIGVDTGNEKLRAVLVLDNSNDASHIDPLGAAISDTAFVFRADSEMVTKTQSSTELRGQPIELSDSDSSVASATNQDALGLMHNMRSVEPLNDLWTIIADNSSPHLSNETEFTEDPADGATIGFELIRQSATSADFSNYPDYSYTTADETINETIASTIQNLRYIKSANRSDRNDSTTSTWDFFDIKLADGVTSPP